MINSFEPIVNKNCKILILGTMPGVQSLKRHEYYGNDRNAFWKIIFSLFQQKLSNDYEQKKEFLLKNRIALWDVLKACNREGSLDNDIKDPIPNNFASFFKQYPNIEAVYFNGEPAEKFYRRLVGVKNSDIFFHRLPSTSPSNAVKFEEKLKYWKPILLMLKGIQSCDIESIEVFLDYSCELKINIKKMNGFYVTEDTENNLIGKRNLAFSEKALIQFIHRLYENRVFSWEKSNKPEVEKVGGPNWRVKITCMDAVYAYTGSNKYPRQWKDFCKSVQSLIEEPFG
ncbi:DNA-deoxyinosine glycosylase [Acetivibrio clariflavus]|uniref:DNA-deoxyinosine glycosylase n=1 Tax=Acetivibrio clariflavus TaxID=288965 RepID=UPI0004ACA812|nr:DNA-deoxyinosine glycosylase [Acetivibrio clariflavus]